MAQPPYLPLTELVDDAGYYYLQSSSTSATSC